MITWAVDAFECEDTTVSVLARRLGWGHTLWHAAKVEAAARVARPGRLDVGSRPCAWMSMGSHRRNHREDPAAWATTPGIFTDHPLRMFLAVTARTYRPTRPATP